MSINEELTDAISSHEIFRIKLFNFEIPISDTVIIMWLIMAFLIIFSIIFTRKMNKIPEGKQNFIETVVELVNNLTKSALGHHWKGFAPYLGTILLFLVVANTISIFNILPTWGDLYNLTHIEWLNNLPSFGIRPPTKDINVTACMAIMTIVVVIGSGIKYRKFTGWLKTFVKPFSFMLPLNIIDYFIKVLSLALRLFGNILAAFIIMELIYLALPTFIPAACSIYFDLFDGILQAYVFVFLTSLYIAEQVEET